MATNAEVVRQIEAAWDSNQLDKLDALFVPGLIQHAAVAGLPATLDNAKQMHQMSMQAMPDRRAQVQETIAEGDKVAVRVRLTGTNTGGFSWLGVPANGNKVDVEWISIYTLKDGKVTEHRAIMDIMGLMQQLGAIPSAGAVPGA
ncbi:MAG TPA: ester cyclase [Dehalococcoidia bacterium]|nr:ester cyclase [Dehalococcoidia bacterium]